MDKVQKIELEECIADIEATLHSIYNYKDKYSVAVLILRNYITLI